MRNEINGVADRAFEHARTRMNAVLDKRPRLVLKPIFDLPPLDGAIVIAERHREYVEAARAVGASPVRLLLRHLLPAASGFLAAQLSLLVPAFILAEATLSYVGFGFPLDTATWGTMLPEAGNVLLLADVPWLLAPVAAIFLTVLAINLLVQATGRPPVQLEG